MSKYNEVMGVAKDPQNIGKLIHSELIDYAFHLHDLILLEPNIDWDSNVKKLNDCKNEIIRRMHGAESHSSFDSFENSNNY